MVSVIIPIYNELELLQRMLPKYMALFDSFGISDVILVNDGSDDDGAMFVRDCFPEIRVINNPICRSVGIAVNIGVKYATYPITWIVSLDMGVESCDLNLVLRYFDRSDVFAVLPSCLDDDDSCLINDCHIGHDGVEFYWNPSYVSCNGCLGLTQSIGSMFVATDKFRFLGGFDELFDPVETPHVDLTLSAYRWGWRSIVSTDIKLKFMDGLDRFGPHDQYVLMNEYLLLWKHMDQFKMWFKHFRVVFFRLCFFRVRHTRAILKALFKIPSVFQSRVHLGKVCSIFRLHAELNRNWRS